MADEKKQMSYKDKVKEGLIKLSIETREATNQKTQEKVEVEVLAIYTKQFDPETGKAMDDDVQVVMYDDLNARIEATKDQLETLKDVKKDFDKLKK